MTHGFEVVVERDEEGYYVASVPELHGCHTQARSLDVLMERIREATELCLEVRCEAATEFKEAKQESLLKRQGFVAYIPKDAKWYLAELVMHIAVEGDSCNVVHTNLVLVRADSPEDAYDRSIELGVAGETSYENSDGKRVNIRFRGLHDLNVIYDDLEHGAEIIFSEDLGMDETAIQKWVQGKEALSVFRPISRSKAPNYCSGEVMNDLYEEFPELKPSSSSNSEIDE